MRLQPNWKWGVSFSRSTGSWTEARRWASEPISAIRERRGASRNTIGPTSSLSQYLTKRESRRSSGWRARRRRVSGA